MNGSITVFYHALDRLKLYGENKLNEVSNLITSLYKSGIPLKAIKSILNNTLKEIIPVVLKAMPVLILMLSDIFELGLPNICVVQGLESSIEGSGVAKTLHSWLYLILELKLASGVLSQLYEYDVSEKIFSLKRSHE